jgi:hypothetical protein
MNTCSTKSISSETMNLYVCKSLYVEVPWEIRRLTSVLRLIQDRLIADWHGLESFERKNLVEQVLTLKTSHLQEPPGLSGRSALACWRQEDGILMRQYGGEIVPVREEGEYFRLTRMPGSRRDSMTAVAWHRHLDTVDSVVGWTIEGRTEHHPYVLTDEVSPDCPQLHGAVGLPGRE